MPRAAKVILPRKIKIPKVKSLMELRQLAGSDDRYKRLLLCASRNLGGSHNETVQQAYNNLYNNATAEPECSEEGVVDEVNGVIDIVEREMNEEIRPD